MTRENLMRTWMLHRWDELRTTFWFLPGLMATAAIVLALLTLELDRVSGASRDWGWTYTGGPEGARAVLSTVASSMITVGGVVFSITIVALSLASAQFGPRLLRNFIRDRSNQFVLGTFTSTFIYCLLVLRTIRGTDDVRFVPGISVTLGILLALASLGVLTYFIHHVAVSIQATQVISTVSQELHETIERLWPEDLGQGPTSPKGSDGPERIAAPDGEPTDIFADATGYVDAIDEDTLLALAKERDLVVRLARRPGQFIVRGSVLASIWPTERVDDQLRRQLNAIYSYSTHRTSFQDVEFAIDQLVEIAVRALSPGINDPFTAVACVDRLGESLCRIAERKAPSPYRHDKAGHLRVITHPVDFASVTDAAFNQIRQYGCDSAAVLIRMLETIAVIAHHLSRDEDRHALERHAELIHRASERAIPEEADRHDVDERFREVQAALRAPRSERFPRGRVGLPADSVLAVTR